jgi:hypothetical protein
MGACWYKAAHVRRRRVGRLQSAQRTASKTAAISTNKRTIPANSGHFDRLWPVPIPHTATPGRMTKGKSAPDEAARRV